ncbi:MAG: hypothetical protein WBV85_07600 [Solirubrobacteraceae bacterium]
MVVSVMNVGASESKGEITITDTLPSGITALDAGNGHLKTVGSPPTLRHSLWKCVGVDNENSPEVAGAKTISCTNDPQGLPSIAGGGGNPGGEIQPGADPQLLIKVQLPNTESAGINQVDIAGGGAPSVAATTNLVHVTSQPAPFGFAGWHVWFSNADGTLDTQAGSHPYEATFSFNLNDVLDKNVGWSAAGGVRAEGSPLEVRNVEVKLPPGLVGNPNAVPLCTRQQLDGEKCPPASQVGILLTTDLGGNRERFRVYNIAPPPGVPNELAFTFVNGVETRLDTGVRSGGDYGLTTRIDDIPQRTITDSTLTLWGVPGDSSHQIWRNFPGISNLNACRAEEIGTEECPIVSGEAKPFLTLPTACGAPLTFSISANTWEEPGVTAEASTQTQTSDGTLVGTTGCEHLNFVPAITVSPDTARADTPAGLTVDVKPPVGGLSSTEGLSTADIQDTTVTLPEGVAINPGQAAGLRACQETEASLKSNDEAPVCPAASKVGVDEIETPLLQKPLQGSVYILQDNPPDLQLLVVASGEGVNVKLIGHVHLTSAGQLVTTLSGTPELPFTSFHLSFSGGAQAALATPTTCGTYTATSDFESWASPFVADAFPTASFAITSGTDGAPCPPSPLPYTPSLIAGSTTDQAGGYTNFSLLLQAPDDQQRTERLQFKVPEGLLGMISKVALCGEPQAREGTCSAASQIGHTVVASGPGPYPLVVPEPGQPPAPIYLTGPYEGAPYGLVIVVPLHVGPFVLQTQIVRAKIEVDPITAQITVTTDAFPQVIDGIPTDLRTINAVIDRPEFMFNPTNCSPMSFSGTAYSAQGTGAPISSHFQMGSCQALKFQPDFKVSTNGKTSRKNGASLKAKIVYPVGNLGYNQASSQSNIQSVKVDLPKQLPSRLTTLQKACPAATFVANPAGCPAESVVGHVKAITPVLPVPLEGPAYFVSHAGEEFPNLILVLQGDNVTVDLIGDTFINPKTSITSSTFKQVPDVPIQSFELSLPQGPYSALAANTNLCKVKGGLKMPTNFIAQNGATIKQNTAITVTGCTKTKKKSSKHKKRGKGQVDTPSKSRRK